jgi:hypothetical protein
LETLRGQLEIVEGQRALLATRVEELLKRNESELRARQSELEERLLAGEAEGKGIRRRLDLATGRLLAAAERESALSRETSELRADLVKARAAADAARDDAEAAALELGEYRQLTKGRAQRPGAELGPGAVAAAPEPPETGSLAADLETRTRERDAAERQLALLRDEHAELRARAEELSERIAESQIEHRAIATDLVRTQGTLQARSEQLQRLLGSRWHRLARSSWRARRQRPPIAAMLLAILAIATAIATLFLAAGPVVLVVGLLGAALIAVAALAYAVVVPALRDSRVPRMAAEGSYALPLSVDVEALKEELAKPPIEPVPAPAQPAPEPVALGDPERQSWLHSARVPDLGELRVAAVLDEMSRASFAPECDLDTGFTMHDWRERLQERPPHLLLVESAWTGNGGGWQYGVGSYAHPRFAGLPALRELVAWCRERDIPTVFWNKEDPVHFEQFKEAAALFDHVFTTDSDRIPAYRELGGDIRTVEALQFAAQPRLHNPIPIVEARRPEPVFAGTYYRNRHRDRQRSLEDILDAARPHGLIIYDRMLGGDSGAYGFPERFLPHVRGRLSYLETIAAYKSHRVFLNVNSVAESPTMFSRRVFELLACGTAVVSTESTGMEATFGELVPVARSKEEAEAALTRLLDDDYLRDLTERAQRLVLGRHTYRDRLLTVARTAGFDVADSNGAETTALVVADEPAELEKTVRSLLAQSTEPDEVLVGLGGGLLERDVDALARRFAGRIRTTAQQPGLSSSERLQELAAMAVTPWVAPLRPSVHYGRDHLRDLIACAGFAEADVIGFGSTGSGGKIAAHRYEEAVSPDAAIADREIVASRGWPDESGEMRRWFAQGVRIYAGDPRRD